MRQKLSVDWETHVPSLDSGTHLCVVLLTAFSKYALSARCKDPRNTVDKQSERKRDDG